MNTRNTTDPDAAPGRPSPDTHAGSRSEHHAAVTAGIPFVIHDSFRDRYREHILLPAGGGDLDYTYNDRWDGHAYRRTTQPDDLALARRIDQAAQPMTDRENERQARLLFGDPPSPDVPRQDGRPWAGPSL